MDILVIKASPREANSNALADVAAQAMRENGAQVHTVVLHNKNIQPCIGCSACKVSDVITCSQQDDMEELLKSVSSCDGLLIASPIYFQTIPATLKQFWERLYPLYHPQKGYLGEVKSSKKMGILFTSAGPSSDGYRPLGNFVGEWFQRIAGVTEFKTVAESGCVRPADWMQHEAYAKDSQALGHWIIAE